MTKVFILIFTITYFFCNRDNALTLTGKWKLIKYYNLAAGTSEEEPANIPRSIIIEFSDDGRMGKMNGHTVTNSVSGAYELLKNNKMKTISFGGTKVAELGWGSKFWNAIHSASSYERQGNKCLFSSMQTMRKWSLQKNKIPTNMKRIFLSLMLINFFYHSFCQSLLVNEISLSQTWIYNKTTVYDIFSGARARNETGTAISNGVNVNYSRTIYKNFYAKIGFGYFKQKFGIHRGFHFKESGTALFFTTKYYAYHTFNYFGGIGYSKSLSKDYGKILPKSSGFRFLTVYNFFNTYKQEFKHTYNSAGGIINPKIRKDNYSFGRSIVLQAGVSRPLYKSLGIGLDILFPIYNRWRKDQIFKEDMEEFHGSDLSMGASVSLIYHIKTKK